MCDTTASLQFEKTIRHDAVLVVSAIAVQGAGKTFVAGADIATLELLATNTSTLDIDVIDVNGHGFPVWRGGPMLDADRLGRRHVLDRLRVFHRDLGARWRPAPLLAELGAHGRTFRGWARARSS